MGEIISLNRARKAKARAEDAAQAAANRARFGRTKAQKARDAQDAARVDATLDAARRDRDQEP